MSEKISLDSSVLYYENITCFVSFPFIVIVLSGYELFR